MNTPYRIAQFEKLLLDFEKVHPSEPGKKPTFLEITGKAHKEDVISNVLAFFFDSSQSHGLNSLFYCTFMKCMGITDDLSEELIEDVSREVTTSKGLRIDLVIETSKRIVAIENKINHWLNNDLEEYAAHIRRLDRVKNCHLAVLSLYPQQVKTEGVPNVTYASFISALETELNLGGVKVADNYAPFLEDFFSTVKNLKSQNMLNEQLRKYFADNEKALNNLIAEKSRFDNDVNEKAHTLKDILESRPEVSKLVWERYVVINQKFFPNGLHLKVDCVIKYDGYWIHVFVHRQGVGDINTTILNSIPYFNNCTNWNTWVNKEVIPHDTPIEEVASKVNEVLRVVFP